MSERDYGQITYWTDRGYGFIRPDKGERDIFVHRNEIDIPADEEIRIGDRVSYVAGEDARNGKAPRPCAKQVRLVVDGDNTDDVGAGMYEQRDTDDSALAEGLRKFIRDQQ